MIDQWQDRLRSRMELHEEPAPEGLWESIEPLMPSENRNRVWGRRVVSLAAVAAMLILFIVLFNTNNEEIEPVELAQESPRHESLARKSIEQESPERGYIKQEIPVQETPVQEIPVQETPLQETPVQFAFEHEKDKIGIPEKGSRSREANKLKENDKTGVPEQASREREVIKQQEADETTGYRLQQSGLEKPNDQLFASNSSRHRKPDNSKWQANMSMSNMPSGSARTYPGYGTLAAQEAVEEQYSFMSEYTRQDVYTDVKHLQPITFGLTLRYYINNRWSVTSGLSYSLLSSKLRAGGNDYNYDDRQTLHYLGVPLNVGYNFWQNNKFTAYLSTGALVEKNIAGTLTSNYYIDNQLEVSTTENISSKYLQWSVNSAAGIEYRFSNFLGVYVEPGIAYYLKNASDINSFYKDNPLNFNLRIGLRFSIPED